MTNTPKNRDEVVEAVAREWDEFCSEPMHADRRKPDDWKLFADDVRETLRFLDKLNIRIVPAEATEDQLFKTMRAFQTFGQRGQLQTNPLRLDHLRAVLSASLAASPYNPQRSEG